MISDLYVFYESAAYAEIAGLKNYQSEFEVYSKEENYFLFVFATGNFIILFTKAASSFSLPLWAMQGENFYAEK